MTNIAKFENEPKLRAFATKKKMKFANFCVQGEPHFDDFAADMRARGLVVLQCNRWNDIEQLAHVAFYP